MTRSSAGRVARRQRKHVQTEAWTPFQSATFPNGTEQALVENDPAYVGVFLNNLYQVTMREVKGTDFGDVLWLCIVRRDRTHTHDWRHLQRIKNELVGPEHEAMELYPAESRLVDTNNQFHLWVFEKGKVIPLGYKDRDVCTEVEGKHKQRPFSPEPPDLNAKPLKDKTARVYGMEGE